MDKSLLLKTFNKHFFDFIEDVNMIVEKNTDIETSHIYFNSIKKANPSLLLKIWHQFIYIPYQEQINVGDLTFFLEKNYSDDLSILPNKKELLNIIDSSLRDPIRNMSEINKSHCMKYIQILCKLSDAYMSITLPK
jgi:hypothetical protein